MKFKYQDLEIWQLAIELIKAMYGLLAKANFTTIRIHMKSA